jgi:hypothetical protein
MRIGGLASYTVLETIGRGAQAVVYRARASTGNEVALKILERSGAEFSGELQALDRLRHPNIAELVDAGIDEGRAWLATALVRGANLRTWLLTRPSDVRPVLKVAASVHAALGHAHAEGIVHLDLKPENVLVGSDDAVRVVDFGLSLRLPGRLGRERAEAVATTGRGTVLYMAPEQIDEGVVDWSTDAYAFGCLLFEMLVGRPPFEGTVREVLEAHLRERAPRVAERSPLPITEELDSLVSELLAKEPRRRRRAFCECGAMFARLGFVVTTPPAPVIARAPFVGRRALLDDLLGQIADGVTSIVIGESGLGKSRLLAEVGAHLRRRDWSVVHAGGSVPVVSAAAKSALRVAMRTVATSLVDLAKERDIDLVRADDAAALAAIGLVGAHGNEVPSRARSPEVARAEGFAAFVDLIARFAAAFGRTAIVLDDAQWLDDLTLDLVDYLLRLDCLAEGVSLVVAGRPESVDDALSRSLSRPGVALRFLTPLADEEVEQLVLESAPLGASPELVSRIRTRAAGSPFGALELLRYASRKAGFTASDALPASVDALIQDRLEALAPDTARLLAVVALLGREGDLHVVRRLAARLEVPPGVVDELRVDGVLEATWIGVRFAHDRLRETVLDRMTADERRAGHAAVAHVLEGDDVPTDASTRGHRLAALGAHWLAAEAPKRAIPHLEGAAELAAMTYSNRAAAEQFRLLVRAGREVGAARVDLARWERRLGECLQLTGAIDDSREHYRAALATLGSPYPRTSLRRVVAVLGVLVRLAFLTMTRGARKERASAEPKPNAIELTRSLQGVTFLTSEPTGFIYCGLRSLEVASAIHARPERGRALSVTAAMLGTIPLHAWRHSLLESALSDTSESPEHEIYVRLVAGYMAAANAEWEDADAHLTAIMRIATQIGDLRHLDEARSILLEVKLATGDLAFARELAAASLLSTRERGDPHLSFYANIDSARLALLHDDIPAAQALVATADLPSSSILADRVLYAGVSAEVAFRAGDRARAIDLATQAIRESARDRSVYHAAFGCAAATAVLLGAREADAASRAARELESFGLVYRAMTPRAALARALVAQLRGRRGTSSRELTRAITLAEQTRMPRLASLAARSDILDAPFGL